MSAPKTNIEKEERRHKPAMNAIRLSLVVAAVLLIGYIGWTFGQTDGPEGTETYIDGRTGEEVPAE